MNPDPASRHPATAAALHAPIPSAAAISAWMDGDLAPADEMALPDMVSDADVDTWHRFHLIGDVLRAGSPANFACSDAARSGERARAFARGIVAQAVWAPAQVAPSLEAVPSTPVVSGAVPTQGPPVHMLPRQPAANDDVYRWKMVAGLASVAAVVAVAWSVVGGSALGSGEGAVLAKAPAPAHLATVSTHLAAPTPPFVTAVAEPVWVSTPQGVVWRDPRMEELMHTHRQAGGGPALQVPAGFLRAATHDVPHR